MNKKTLIVWASASTIIAVVVTALLIFKCCSSRHNYGRYEPLFESAQDCIDMIIKTDYDKISARESLVDLQVHYSELSFIYELYLADCRNSPYACIWVYEDLVRLYEKVGVDIPPVTFNLALELLKKGAMQPDEYNDDDADPSICYSYLYDIYNEGKYVPRDTAMANYYLKMK